MRPAWASRSRRLRLPQPPVMGFSLPVAGPRPADSGLEGRAINNDNNTRLAADRVRRLPKQLLEQLQAAGVLEVHIRFQEVDRLFEPVDVFLVCHVGAEYPKALEEAVRRWAADTYGGWLAPWTVSGDRTGIDLSYYLEDMERRSHWRRQWDLR